MDTCEKCSSLNCELRIIRANNLDNSTNGTVFVRYYILSENGERIRLNTREVPSSSMCDPCWNESILLECSRDKDVIDELSQQSIVFELRSRNSKSIFGRSKVLGTAEISWLEVLESTELSVEKWVPAISKNNNISESLKPASLQIGMKITVPETAHTLKTKNQNRFSTKSWKECGCKHGGCSDTNEDVFAVSATLEVF
ncbi:hypothetical protein C5167_027031 [Papaver somniferum]|uniref:uncharacterized protein LOC113335977 n=1 Tax=Papaver somniferum TaxID=3469 RepID=UPI000E6F4A3F|nr:uncharacterized protein LOC113335977 [Papaver somniferum]RZC89489.1 hypothetical protein C5167_027031 [Papaver somniferum]